jgi:glycosyltransferase involved in cell wall biosynthesis
VRRLIVVGAVTGYHSYPTVMQGLLRGLCAAGLRPEVADQSTTGGRHAGGALDGMSIRWLDAGESSEVTTTAVPGAVYFVLNPTVVFARACVEAGSPLVGMHVVDVDRLPAHWIEAIAAETLTVVPSCWMERVVRSSGFASKDVIVANHGVGPAFRRQPPGVPHGPFWLLHTCSSVYFPERKGTPQLLEAFDRLIRWKRNVQLTFIVPMLTKPIRRLLGGLSGEARDRVLVQQHPEGMPAEAMVALYAAAEALVVPSRAEGFGLQSLEMRACGRPVAQTLCTGMVDHLPPGEGPVGWGIIPIAHGEMAPAWGDFGLAPTVTAENIEGSLLHLLDRRAELTEMAQARADEVAEAWAWERTTAGLAEALRALCDK